MNVAHQMTDNLLIQLEQRINTEYSQAAREIEDKLNAYLSRMEDKYADKLELVRNGEMTPAELSTWFNNQLLVGNRWAEMRDTLAEDLTNTNQIAASMINGHTPEVYALNHNYGTFEVEEQSQINTSYTLYDRWTVERLLRDDPDLTPNMAPEARINVPLDQRWNRRQINSAIIQGVLQGESIPAIARRLGNVTNMNRTSAIRNARTMTTSAECGGRLDSYIRAENMGIEMKQAWIATHDSRTRFSHAQMDGETAVVGEKFSNGCKFPGDPEGKPEEVYNCRCTIIGIVEGSTLSDDMLSRREYWDNDERYQEWVRRHEEPQINTEGRVVHGQDISATWERRPDEFQFEIQDVINAQGFDGLPRVVSPEEFDRAVEESGFIAQRTYSAPDQETLDAYRDQLYHGTWYVDCSTGGAQYGQGMYCAADYNGQLTQGIRNEMIHYQELGGSRFGRELSDEERMQRALYEAEQRGVTLTDDVRAYIEASYSGDWARLASAQQALQGNQDIISTLNNISIPFNEAAPSYVETLTLAPDARIIELGDLMQEQTTFAENFFERSIADALGENASNLEQAMFRYANQIDTQEDRAIIREFRGAHYEHNDDFREMYESNVETWRGIYRDIRDQSRTYEDMDSGAFAALRGYDAINASGHGESGSYTVIVNRTAVIFRGE